MSQLSEASRALLREVLALRAPADMAEFRDTEQLAEEEIEKLRDIVMDEFCSNGLGAGDEPNRYGLALERLIDELSVEKDGG